MGDAISREKMQIEVQHGASAKATSASLDGKIPHIPK